MDAERRNIISGAWIYLNWKLVILVVCPIDTFTISRLGVRMTYFDEIEEALSTENALFVIHNGFEVIVCR
jgi:hypothetical protein